MSTRRVLPSDLVENGSMQWMKAKFALLFQRLRHGRRVEIETELRACIEAGALRNLCGVSFFVVLAAVVRGLVVAAKRDAVLRAYLGEPLVQSLAIPLIHLMTARIRTSITRRERGKFRL